MAESRDILRRAGPAMRGLLEVRLGEEAERLERSADGRGAREDWRALAEALRSRLAGGTWTARRGIEEKLLTGALREALGGRLDAEFLPENAGAGRGRFPFARTLRTARAARLPWALVARVADVHSNADHETLEFALAGPPFWLERDIRGVVMEVTRAATGGKGIAPENALARLLGDVYLHGVDEFLAREGRVFRRAFDGLVVFCESRAQAERTLAELGEHLRASRGLELSAAETKIRRRRAGFSAR